MKNWVAEGIASDVNDFSTYSVLYLIFQQKYGKNCPDKGHQSKRHTIIDLSR